MRVMFSELRRKWRTTNMGLERLLKDIKQSYPSFYGSAFAETVSLMAPLSTLWRDHLQAGGVDPFKESREMLEQAGLPVQKFRNTRTRVRANARASLSYPKVSSGRALWDVGAVRRASSPHIVLSCFLNTRRCWFISPGVWLPIRHLGSRPKLPGGSHRNQNHFSLRW